MKTFEILASDLQIISADDTAFAAVFTPKEDFPPFAGHFPDMAIMPGVAQISVVTAAVRKIFGDEIFLKEIVRCKFTNPSVPGVQLEISGVIQSAEDQTKLLQIQITGDGKRISNLKLLYAMQERS